jgi:hypothetical protein
MENMLTRYSKNINANDIDGMSCMETVRMLSTERNLGLIMPRNEDEYVTEHDVPSII